MTLPVSLLCKKENGVFNCCEVGCWWMLDYGAVVSFKMHDKNLKRIKKIYNEWHEDDKKLEKFTYIFNDLKKLKYDYEHIILVCEDGRVKILNKETFRWIVAHDLYERGERKRR